MKAAVRRALEEALHRYLDFHQDEELAEAWTGLGYISDYRQALEAGMMEWVYGRPPPRCTGWLRLTEAGANIVGEWLEDV